MENIERIFGINAEQIMAAIMDLALRLALSVVILVIGFWLAKVLSRSVERLLLKKQADVSLVGFLRSLTSVSLKVLVIITAITQLGVEMTSFVAILGAAGLAVGMAFSGTLSNFAGGVMILFFRPFKVGDYVQVQGEEGTVDEVQIFNTILTTIDNKVIILANGAVANGTIVNFTKAKRRRVDLTYGIAYGDDLKQAKDLLMRFMNENNQILKDPAPFVGLGELADSSVNLTVRAWVNTEDYWDVFFSMNERVYNEFDQHGLSIPFPQVEMHVQNGEINA